MTDYQARTDVTTQPNAVEAQRAGSPSGAYDRLPEPAGHVSMEATLVLTDNFALVVGEDSAGIYRQARANGHMTESDVAAVDYFSDLTATDPARVAATLGYEDRSSPAQPVFERGPVVEPYGIRGASGTGARQENADTQRVMEQAGLDPSGDDAVDKLEPEEHGSDDRPRVDPNRGPNATL